MRSCPKCQAQNEDHNQICTSCGASLVEQTENVNQSPEVTASVSQPALEPTSESADSTPKKGKGLAIASLVLGIVALLTGVIAPLAIICGLLAIVFGAISLKKSKGLAIAGLITGILGLLGGIFWGAIIALIMSGTDAMVSEISSELSPDSIIGQTMENDIAREANELPSTTNTKRVGSASVGYVSLPSNFVSFLDVEGAEGLQWADGPGSEVGSRIVTLDTSSGKPAAYTEVYSDPEKWATSIMMSMDEYGSPDYEGARVDFNGYEAFQVYGTFPNGTVEPDGTFSPPSVWVVTIFQIEDGSVRYLSIEGPIAAGFFDFFEAVSDSYEVN